MKVVGVKKAMTYMSMWSESSWTYSISEYCVWVTLFDVITWYNTVGMRMYFVCKFLLSGLSLVCFTCLRKGMVTEGVNLCYVV